jgi:hypothetical protein
MNLIVNIIIKLNIGLHLLLEIQNKQLYLELMDGKDIFKYATIIAATLVKKMEKTQPDLILSYLSTFLFMKIGNKALYEILGVEMIRNIKHMDLKTLSLFLYYLALVDVDSLPIFEAASQFLQNQFILSEDDEIPYVGLISPQQYLKIVEQVQISQESQSSHPLENKMNSESETESESAKKESLTKNETDQLQKMIKKKESTALDIDLQLINSSTISEDERYNELTLTHSSTLILNIKLIWAYMVFTHKYKKYKLKLWNNLINSFNNLVQYYHVLIFPFRLMISTNKIFIFY